MSSGSFIATSERQRKERADSPPLLRSLWFNVGVIGIDCLAAGSRGQPVVILHGGGFDAAGLSFRKTIPVLAKQHRVFAPDWPGFGESDAMPRNWCVEECVDFVADLLDALGLKRVILIGLSMGGAFALGFTLRSPKRVERLVLVDSVGLGGGIPGGLVSYFALHLPLVDELRWALLPWVPTLARRSMCAPLLNQSGAAIEEAFCEIIRLARKPGSGAAFRQLQRSEYRWQGLRTNYLDRLSEIQVPTLIVHGAEDRLIPVACAQRAHRLIPHSQLQIVAGCGHLPPVEQPESFNRIISSFLRNQRRPVRAKICPMTGDLAQDKTLISHGQCVLAGRPLYTRRFHRSTTPRFRSESPQHVSGLPTNPDFEAKFWGVIGLYLNPPEQAVVFFRNEKSQIQALQGGRPGLQLGKGHICTQAHHYCNGTVALCPALEYLCGKVIAHIAQTDIYRLVRFSGYGTFSRLAAGESCRVCRIVAGEYRKTEP